MKPTPNHKTRRAMTIIEIVVAMAVLLTGIVVILTLWPTNLRQNQRITDTSVAAYLAQMKAEEIRKGEVQGRFQLDRRRDRSPLY